MNLEISGIQKRLTRHKDRPLHQVLQLTDITRIRQLLQEGQGFRRKADVFGLLGRDETLVIPWTDIETLGVDAILVRTELPEPEAKKQGFWQKMRHWLDG